MIPINRTTNIFMINQENAHGDNCSDKIRRTYISY